MSQLSSCAAYRAVLIFFQSHGAPLHAHGIEDHQAVLQGVADVTEKFDGLQCLHAAEYADHRRKDTVIATVGVLFSIIIRVEAGITGAVLPAQVKHTDLPVELNRRGRYKW